MFLERLSSRSFECCNFADSVECPDVLMCYSLNLNSLAELLLLDVAQHDC